MPLTRLRLSRLRQGVTLTELAERLRINLGDLSGIERGQRMPSAQVTQKLEHYYDTPIVKLLRKVA